MRKYHQLTSEERHALSALRKQGLTNAEIGRALGRHRSTIGRELARNTRKDGGYRPSTAQEATNGRRSKSRRNRQFREPEWALVVARLEIQWSPEQIAGRLKKSGELRISHETIYRYVWRDRREGGGLYRHLRGVRKKRRKRYGRYDSRGRLAGKRLICERPAGADNRSRVGHLEADTVLGSSDKHCVLTLVDRRTGYVMIGKLEARNAVATNERAISLIRGAERRVRTVTVDNGTEFHSYEKIEAATRRTILLRDTTPRVGARYLREHQRPHSSVPAEASEHAPASLNSTAHASRASSMTDPANDSATSPPRSAMNYRTLSSRCTSKLMSR